MAIDANGNSTRADPAHHVENRKLIWGCIPCSWFPSRKRQPMQAAHSAGENDGTRNLDSGNDERPTPAKPVGDVVPAASNNNIPERESHPPIVTPGESSPQIGDTAQSDPSEPLAANIETQSTSFPESTQPLEQTTTSPPTSHRHNPPSSIPLPPPQLIVTEPNSIDEPPLIPTGRRMERESSAVHLSPNSNGEPPPYEPGTSGDSHSQAGSAFSNVPQPSAHRSDARKDAERKFKEAADKLHELVRKTRPESGFQTSSDFSDVEIDLHANSVKKILEDFLRVRGASKATQSKSSQFIDKWAKATITIMKSTLQLLNVFALLVTYQSLL